MLLNVICVMAAFDVWSVAAAIVKEGPVKSTEHGPNVESLEEESPPPHEARAIEAARRTAEEGAELGARVRHLQSAAGTFMRS